MEYPPRLPRVNEDLNESTLLSSILEDLLALDHLPTDTIDKYCTSFHYLSELDDEVIEWVRQWMKLVSLDSKILNGAFEGDFIRFTTNDDHGHTEDLRAFGCKITDHLTLREILTLFKRPYDLLKQKYESVSLYHIHLDVNTIKVEFDINYPRC